MVKTKTQYEPDRKKSKARSPKIAEFTVSITEGVTERFKVSGPGSRARESGGQDKTHLSGWSQVCKTSPVPSKFLLYFLGFLE